MEELVNDDAFFYAVDSPEIEGIQNADQLMNTHLFGYHQNPATLNKPITFLTLQVHIPEISSDNILIKTQLEIWIISHETCMNTANIPDSSYNKNDYISRLLDNKFTGRTYLGTEEDPNKLQLYGCLDLVSNIEGCLEENYLYRRMIFETSDLNDSICDGGKYGIS